MTDEVTIADTLLIGGLDVPIYARVSFMPQTRQGRLVLDEGVVFGPFTADTDPEDGTFSLNVPIVENVLWSITVTPLADNGSVPPNGRKWSQGNYEVTAETTQLEDFVETEELTVTPTLRDSLLAAAAQAEAAKDAAEAVGATSDAQVAANVETGPLTGAALSATIDQAVDDLDLPATYAPAADSPNYVARTDNLALLPNPFYVAHRMDGGATPEATMEGARIAVAGGADMLEMDLQPLADGSLGVMHDATTTRTTGVTANVVDLTAPIWRSLNAAYPVPWNSLRVPPALFSEVLADFAGKVPLMVEPKDTSNATQLMDTAEEFGIKGSLIIATSSSTVLTAAKARGFKVMFFWLGALTGTTPAAAVSAGADWLGLDGVARPDADVTTLVTTGLPVVAFTVNRRVTRDHLAGLGVEGFLTDQPVYLKRATAMSKVDSWRYGVLGQGFVNYNNTAGPPNVSIAAGAVNLLTAANAVTHLVGEVCPLANAAGTYSIEVQIAMETLPSLSTGAAYVAFGMLDDSIFNNLTAQRVAGYQLYITKGGDLRLYKNTAPSTATLLGSAQATSALVADTFITVKIDVTPTQITLTRTDSGGYTPIVVADASHRGGYVHVGKFNCADANVKFKGLTVAP